jgi:recombinational DNA repair protein RecR
MKHLKLFETFKERNIENAIKNLTKDRLKEKIIIVNRTVFNDSTIIYYSNKYIYEGNFVVVREKIKQRGGDEPTQEEADEIILKLKENNKRRILFNLRVSQHYGNWVIEADKIIKAKKIDVEDAQISLNAYDQTWGKDKLNQKIT